MRTTRAGGWETGSVTLKHRVARSVAPAVLALGVPRVRRLGRAAPRRTAPAAPLFEIYTFVTDKAVYEEMRRSYAAAGFQPPLTEFTPLTDGRDGGPALDPYAAITQIGAVPRSRYAILCHQDVRLDRGAGSNELISALERLDAEDRSWVVAGNAGLTRELRLVRRLCDPHGGSTSDRLPVRVVTLDENFLVFNRKRVPRCTPGLRGFHFYGADVCLNAFADGGTAYVIDFLLTHLSPGTVDNDYAAAQQRFENAWDRRSSFLFVGTTCTQVVFCSRWRLLRRLFRSPRGLALMKSVVPPAEFERASAISALVEAP
jgi:hypothetical protein